MSVRSTGSAGYSRSTPQADQDYRLTALALSQIAVRAAGGAMVPLDTVVSAQPASGPALITAYNLYPTATVIGAPAPGYSSGEAMAAMERIARETLPRGVGFSWTAMSYQEKAVGNQMVFAFGAALILVYLVLAGQYESWFLPLAVVLGVPLALTGPALVLNAVGVANNLYTPDRACFCSWRSPRRMPSSSSRLRVRSGCCAAPVWLKRR